MSAEYQAGKEGAAKRGKFLHEQALKPAQPASAPKPPKPPFRPPEPR